MVAISDKIESDMALLFNSYFVRAMPKVSGLDILDNNIFHNLYISEAYILENIIV